MTSDIVNLGCYLAIRIKKGIKKAKDVIEMVFFLSVLTVLTPISGMENPSIRSTLFLIGINSFKATASTSLLMEWATIFFGIFPESHNWFF
jgi:hypothetical protein